jgi:hypothetical protein
MSDFEQSYPYSSPQGEAPEAALKSPAGWRAPQVEPGHTAIRPARLRCDNRRCSKGHNGRHRKTIIRLPSVLTVPEMAFVMRLNPEVIRRRIRARTIRLSNYSTPYRIPCRLLEEMGINLDDAAVDLSRFWSGVGSIIPPLDSTNGQAA